VFKTSFFNSLEARLPTSPGCKEYIINKYELLVKEPDSASKSAYSMYTNELQVRFVEIMGSEENSGEAYVSNTYCPRKHRQFTIAASCHEVLSISFLGS
jgi:hypothetical protein